MYPPPAFAEADPDGLHRLIRENSFGLLISQGPEGPMATHVPFLLETGGPHGLGRLTCHLARENPQWRGITEAGSVLAVFSGPHAYVTPSWYTDRRAVPTWNYVAVHARGRAIPMHDPVGLRRLVDALAAAHEAGRPAPWSSTEIATPAIDRLLGEIVGIEIAVERLEGKRKLSQNRSAADRAGVIAGLRSDGGELSLAVAAAMAAG